MSSFLFCNVIYLPKMIKKIKFPLDFQGANRYNNYCYGRLAQLVEHLLDVQRVRDSSSLASTKKKALAIASAFFNDVCFQQMMSFH